MKGVFEIPEFTWVLIFVVFALFMFFFSLFTYIVIIYPSSGRAPLGVLTSATVTDTYLMGHVISHYSIREQTVFERILEDSISGVPGSSTAELDRTLKGLFEAYRFSNYWALLSSGDKKIIEVQRQDRQCGESGAGFCSAVSRFGDSCGVGRIGIDAKDLCLLGEICCEENEGEYKKTGVVTVVHCGSGGEGICSYDSYDNRVPFSGTCDPGRSSLGRTAECTTVNDGKTPVCCVPNKMASLKNVGIVIEIPFFSKGKPASFFEVGVSK